MAVKIAVITVSDSSFAKTREDVSGPTLKSLIEESKKNFLFEGLSVVPDNVADIADELKRLLENDVIITTGGTGFSPRDVTPEATLSVIQKRCSGLESAIHVRSLQATPMAALSRSIAGIVDRTLIVNFPGSPKAVKECWQVLEPILEHGVALIRDEVSQH